MRELNEEEKGQIVHYLMGDSEDNANRAMFFGKSNNEVTNDERREFINNFNNSTIDLYREFDDEYYSFIIDYYTNDFISYNGRLITLIDKYTKDVQDAQNCLNNIYLGYIYDNNGDIISLDKELKIHKYDDIKRDINNFLDYDVEITEKTTTEYLYNEIMIKYNLTNEDDLNYIIDENTLKSIIKEKIKYF